MALILDGKKIAAGILQQAKDDILQLPFQPVLIDVVVGGDPVTMDYVNRKKRRAEDVGIAFQEVWMSMTSTQEEVQAKILELNNTPNLCGLIIQLPLPAGLDQQKILDCVDPEVDVDVLTTSNVALFKAGQPLFMPATPEAVMRVLAAAGPQYQGANLSGKRVVIIGEGKLVGEPVMEIMRHLGADVQSVNHLTPKEEVQRLCSQAEVIISAAGQQNLVTKEMVAPYTVVIDAGTSDAGGSVRGDVDFDAVKDIVAAISPVPGGVGPVTVAMLMHNVCLVAKSKGSLKEAV